MSVSGRDDFIAAREAIMARKREELGEPPTPEDLLAYRDGRLDPAARELLEAKIAVYPEAARALADLAAFPDIAPGPGTPELSDQEMDASWEAFRQRLEKLPRPAPARPAFPVPSPMRRPAPWQGAAAAVLFLSIGLGIGYLLGAGRPPAPDAAVRPSLNTTIAQLEPLDEDRLRAAAAPFELPDESDELLLILVLPGTQDYPGYAAEIFNREGTKLWAGDGLRPTAEGTVRMSFDRSAFPPGSYRIHLFGQDGKGQQKAVGKYELRVALTPVPSPISGRGV